MIQRKLIEIFQNVIRLAILITLPLWFLINYTTSSQSLHIPVWASIAIGAFLGGFIFTPAMNIGNLVWDIISIKTRQALNIPTIEEELTPFEALQYSKWEQELRQATIFKIFKRTLPGTAKVAAWVTLFMAIISIVGLVALYMGTPDQPLIWQPCLTIAAALLMFFLITLAGLSILAIMTIKIYFNKYT